MVATAARDDNFSYRLWRYDGAPGELIPLLQSAQDHFGYIPRRAISYISGVTGVPESEIYGVITFYSQFRLQPMGKYVIKACDGTACHVRKSAPVLEALRNRLGLSEEKKTTPDMLFTVETVSCLGACGLAPVVVIDEDVHGQMTPESAVSLIEDLLEKEERNQS